jgi:hypothetical protein
MMMLTYFFFVCWVLKKRKKKKKKIKVDEWECFIIQKLVSFFFGATMSDDAWAVVDMTKKICNGWLLTFSDRWDDYEFGRKGGKRSVAFFDIDEATRAVKKIAPDVAHLGFKQADLAQLVSWIKSRVGESTAIYGNRINGSFEHYSLTISCGKLRSKWSLYSAWETLEKSANKD